MSIDRFLWLIESDRLLRTNTSVKKAAPMTRRRIDDSGPRIDSQLFCDLSICSR